MVGEPKIENPEQDHNGVSSDSIINAADGSVDSGEDGMPSDSASFVPVSGDATSGSKGYTGVFPQLNDHGYCHADGPSGIQSMPRYDQYTRKGFMGVDGRYHRAHSSGYPKSAVAYESETGYAKFRANSSNSLNSSSALAGKSPALAARSNSHQYPALSNLSKPGLHGQPHKMSNKASYLGPNFKSMGPAEVSQPIGNFSSFSDRRQGFFRNNGPMNSKPDNRTRYESDRYKMSEKSFRNEGFNATGELTRGPRAQMIATANRSFEKEALRITVQRDKYNQQDFHILYEMAKFFMIKSYSEDDIHKCIKYDVWASTPNGNKKLDAAFHEAEAKATVEGLKCPIFLFFSVNGSGQFVGVAEMIGQVDFNKDMDFWQQDKWNGFFPVTWHIVKDIPNTQLRHIILENNENKCVTHSRDTQEIPFTQGLKMLEIFKSYAAKTSILDDFDFYEDREKLLHAKRSKPDSAQVEDYYSGRDSPGWHVEQGHYRGERRAGEGSTRAMKPSDPAPSIVDLTKNLTLRDRPPPRHHAAPEPLVRPMPSAPRKAYGSVPRP